MIFPELAAPTSQPCSEPYLAPATRLPEAADPQSWQVSVADAKYHWYDLIAGFPDVPDIRDPIGRYLRRMQFELEAAAEQHHLFFAVLRPRVRFDTHGAISWGFFSLKLTLPLLVGADGAKENLAIDLKVPFAATIKKPSVTLTANFVSLNWGGLIEAFSIHDVLQNHAHNLKIPGKVVYVGQTRDRDQRLSKGRLPALQKLHAHFRDQFDMLLLVQRLDVQVSASGGDPASQPRYADPVAAEGLQRDRMAIIKAVLIRYFEGAAPPHRNHEERTLRRARLTEARLACQLVQLDIDLQLPDAGQYRYLCSEQVAPARRHLLSCDIVDGEAVVTALPWPGKKAQS